MTSIFSDEQRASLMDSMTNPESNARKMIEQNAEIGISPDVTTEILNKFRKALKENQAALVELQKSK